MDLQDWSDQFRLFAEPTRVRLLALLSKAELTVAELCEITGLQQPRVSTHLAKLREAALVRDRKAGVSSFYRMDTDSLSDSSRRLWEIVSTDAKDPVLAADANALQRFLRSRAAGDPTDSVADDLERHYTPGRTWEALARSTLQLLTVGDVLDVASGDGALAELLAPRSQRYVCLDVSQAALEASAPRLTNLPNVELQCGDMHDLPFRDRSFDLVVLMQAINYSRDPATAVRESARVLRSGGRMLVTTLAKHGHTMAHRTFDHLNMGFEVKELRKMLENAGLRIESCQKISRERRHPNFELIAATATKD